jgi:hypothetical protein
VPADAGRPLQLLSIALGPARLHSALGGVHIVQDSAIMKGRRLAAYVIDGTLMFLGVLGLLIESSRGKPSSTHFYGYVLAVLFLACGAIIFVGMRSAYGGGAWSLVGVLLVAAAIARITSMVQGLIQGRELRSPVVFCSTIAALWGVGCYCLAWGHIRRRLKEPNKSLHAAAAEPGS